MPVLLLSPHSCGTSYLIMVLYGTSYLIMVLYGTGYLIMVLSISMQMLYFSTIFLSI